MGTLEADSQRWAVRSTVFGSLFGLLVCNAVQAQVIPDGSLNTIVTSPTSDNFTITNGSASGSNLFHSFTSFSIPTNGSAVFDLVNTPNVSTIFGRVTGSNLSNIDGLIKTVNNSNPVSLFLLNPNGIIFGSKARLNVGGSFVAKFGYPFYRQAIATINQL